MFGHQSLIGILRDTVCKKKEFANSLLSQVHGQNLSRIEPTFLRNFQVAILGHLAATGEGEWILMIPYRCL